MPSPSVHFVSEALQPDIATIDATTVAVGAPALPQRFRWGRQTLAISAVESAWRESGPCRHGSGEIYAKKHWFDVRTTDGRAARIYFERSLRGRKRLERWWLYSLTDKNHPYDHSSARRPG